MAMDEAVLRGFDMTLAINCNDKFRTTDTG